MKYCGKMLKLLNFKTKNKFTEIKTKISDPFIETLRIQKCTFICNFSIQTFSTLWSIAV